MDRKKLLEETELFVLDMDGTFYQDTQILDGSLEFLRQVERHGKRYVFFQNNSSKSPMTYIDKLAKIDCHIRRDQIITSGDVMIEYLKMYYPGKRVYLVGTPDLEENFRENGILLTKDMPDVVVIGFDMTLTYEKLERACTYIRSGAVFLATHLDINCPTRDGFIPERGALCPAIALYTAALVAHNTVPAVGNGMKAVAALREKVHTAHINISTSVALADTAGQLGLTAAFLE